MNNYLAFLGKITPRRSNWTRATFHQQPAGKNPPSTDQSPTLSMAVAHRHRSIQQETANIITIGASETHIQK